MPEITICPDCDRKLKVPDEFLGKKVRCPRCDLPFIAQAGKGLHMLVTLPDSVPVPSIPQRSEGYSERRSEPPPLPPREEERRPRPRDVDDEEDDRRSRRRDNDDDDRRSSIRVDKDDRRPGRYDDDDDRRSRNRDDDDDRRSRTREDDDDDEDYPSRRPPKSAKGLRGVRLGLSMVIIAGWIFIGVIGVVAIGAGMAILIGVSLFNAPTQRSAVGGIFAAGIGVILFIGIIGLLNLAELILRLVGYGMCIQVPVRRNSSVKALAIAALCCAGAAALINFSGAAFEGGRGGMASSAAGYGGSTFGSLAGLLTFAGYTCWLFFLRSLALQYRNDDTAQRLVSCLISWIVFGVVGFIVTLVFVIAGAATVFGTAGRGGNSVGHSLGFMAILGAILFGALGLGWVVLYIRYILLVVEVRDEVDRQLEKKRA